MAHFTILLAVASAALFGAPATVPVFLHNGVTAHRGDSGNYPENTMAAIDHALELGADWIEIDIFRTQDGELVVTHDATTEHVGDKHLVVAESTLAELQSVDVATGFRTAQGKSLEDCPPHTMPTLRQVLVRIRAQDKTRLSIQPKMDVVDDAIGLVRELDATAWVGFNDGDLKKMARVKERAPEIPVFWDRFQAFDATQDIQIAKQHGFESLVVHVNGLTPEKIALVKAAGLEIGAWTVNDEKTMRHLLAMGVERIYTDYPDRLLALIREGRP